MPGIGINYFDRRKFWISALLFLFFFFVLSFFLPSLPWKDGFSTVGRTRCYSGTPPCEGVSPFWGPLALLAPCVAEEKWPSPGRGGARKPPRVKRVLPFQVGRKYRQGFRESSFHFSERTSPVPPQSTSGFPLRERTPRPMGLQLAKTRSLKGGVRAVRKARWESPESHPKLSTQVS